MKKIWLIAIFFLIYPELMAQDYTGIWKGKIMTTEKFLPYELAISDSNGILSGYSYTTYTVNSVEMVAVRKIKVRVEGNTLYTDDVELLFDSFQDKIAKKIKQHNKLTYELLGNKPTLKGSFETDKTKNLRSASGEIELSKTPEIAKTDVGKKLADMQLLQSMSFTPLDPALQAKVLLKASRMPYPQRQWTVAELKGKPYMPVVYKDLSIRKVVAPPVAANAPVRTPENKQVAAKEPKAAVNEKPKKNMVSTVSAAPSAAKALAGRTVENIETIYFDSDSLLFTLYDNGEVDGDTVSVIMNGKMILARQGLSIRPINKTVYVPKGTEDELQIVMYAETLGSIPPNTGLLIIQDGNVRHEVRFSGDLEKNAGITLRRRTE